MRPGWVVVDPVVALVGRVRAGIRRLQRRVDPRYQELYRFEIRSSTRIDRDRLREALESEVCDDVEIEVTIESHSWFTVEHLEPREATWYCMHTSPPHSEARATVVVALSGDWEAVDELVPEIHERLGQFGFIRDVEMDTDVHEPLSELEVDSPLN